MADGANSRFGRALGTAAGPLVPQGMALRGYYESPMHDDPWIESALDMVDRNGNSLPGYGWIFPVGDGTINVGVGLLSTFRDYRAINTSQLWTSARPPRPSTGGSARRPRWASRPAVACPWPARCRPRSGPTGS